MRNAELWGAEGMARLDNALGSSRRALTSAPGLVQGMLATQTTNRREATPNFRLPHFAFRISEIPQLRHLAGGA
jgi:hypothetical protein